MTAVRVKLIGLSELAVSWEVVSEGVVSAENDAIEARKWQARGVSIIGGCCGIGCEHIGVLSKSLYE